MRDRRRCNSPSAPHHYRAISQWASSLEWRHAVTLHILVGKICISFFLFYYEGMLSLIVLWLCDNIRQENLEEYPQRSNEILWNILRSITNARLAIHTMRIHKEKRLHFKCQKCIMSFSTEGHMKNHTKTCGRAAPEDGNRAKCEKLNRAHHKRASKTWEEKGGARGKVRCQYVDEEEDWAGGTRVHRARQKHCPCGHIFVLIKHCPPHEGMFRDGVPKER